MNVFYCLAIKERVRRFMGLDADGMFAFREGDRNVKMHMRG